MVVLFAMLFMAPVRNYLEHKRTNTDAVDTPKTMTVKETLMATPEKAEFAEMAGPRSANSSVVQSGNGVSAVKVAEAVNYDRIEIGGNTLPIKYVNDTMIDAGNYAAQVLPNYIYAHNYSYGFGVLAYLGEGSMFTVTRGGVSETYVIRVKMDVMKARAETLRLNLQTSRYGGVQYDMTLITCSGVSLGGGDATGRIIIFASRA